MRESLTEINDYIHDNREIVIDKLVQFLLTDTLLFMGDKTELFKRQEKEWTPMVKWFGELLATSVKQTANLKVNNEENKVAGYKLKAFLQTLSDKELTVFYVLALDMRSVILAAAVVKQKISAKEAFHCALLEELWQNEEWGADEEILAKREDIEKELIAAEKFLKQ